MRTVGGSGASAASCTGRAMSTVLMICYTGTNRRNTIATRPIDTPEDERHLICGIRLMYLLRDILRAVADAKAGAEAGSENEQSTERWVARLMRLRDHTNARGTV